MKGAPDTNRRRQRHRAGQRAEWIAVLWLIAKGYRPLAHRFAIRGGEIDLIVRRRDIVAFVEVKARGSLLDALQAVDAVKRRRMRRGIAVWLARNPWAHDFTLRGDIVAIRPWRLPTHRENAISLL